jgi:hypothetical protein
MTPSSVRVGPERKLVLGMTWVLCRDDMIRVNIMSS